MGKKKKKAEKEERYVITLKGLAYLALANSGIKFTELSFEFFWNEFETSMRKAGYIVDDESDSDS